MSQFTVTALRSAAGLVGLPAALCALLLAAAAPADGGPINLITNGDFTAYTQTPGKVTATGLTGWTNNTYSGSANVGYNFLYLSGAVDKTASLQMWGTNNGGLNTITDSPVGGNILGMDGAYQQSAMSQTLSGLTIGTQYYVSFYFAGAQQLNFSGTTTEQFAVSLQSGNTALAPTANCTTSGVQCTGILTNASHGFTGWNFAGFTFTATAATDTLSFLAIGTPNGQPPFSMLSGVSLQIPEPASIAGLLAGIGALALVRRSRKAAVGG